MSSPRMPSIALFAALVFTAGACTEAPTESPVDGPPGTLAARGGVPGPPGGGGGGGDDGGDGNSGDPAYTLTIVDPASATDPAIRMYSDGAGDYTENISVGRQLVFDPDEKHGTRQICFRFTADQETTGAGIHPDLAGVLDGSGAVCSAGDLRTVWHENGSAGLEGMSLVGETILAEMRYIWSEPGTNLQFKVEFFCRDDRGNDGDGTACGNLVEVTLESDTADGRTWRLGFDSGLEAVVSRNFLKGKPNPFEALGAFHVPFDLTVSVRE